MTKEDELAGVRALEHLVDTVILLESENNEQLRSLVATKTDMVLQERWDFS